MTKRKGLNQLNKKPVPKQREYNILPSTNGAKETNNMMPNIIKKGLNPLKNLPIKIPSKKRNPPKKIKWVIVPLVCYISSSKCERGNPNKTEQ